MSEDFKSKEHPLDFLAGAFLSFNPERDVFDNDDPLPTLLLTILPTNDRVMAKC